MTISWSSLAGWKSEIATLCVTPNSSATANIVGSQTLTDLIRDNLDAEDGSDASMARPG